MKDHCLPKVWRSYTRQNTSNTQNKGTEIEGQLSDARTRALKGSLVLLNEATTIITQTN